MGGKLFTLIIHTTQCSLWTQVFSQRLRFLCIYSPGVSVKEMEADVNRVLKGGSPHEVMCEGFGLSLTRKDLQTLSSLNWLNDEVSYTQAEPVWQ